MKLPCIIFACSILSKDRLFVLYEFLDSFQKNFPECDIYVGINYNSVPEVENILNKSALKITHGRSTEDLYSHSDASAYQHALKLLHQSKKKYKNYWFIHSKGAVHDHSDYLRKWYIQKLIDNRKNIESILELGIGSYGLLGYLTPSEQDQPYNYDIDLPIFSINTNKIFKYSRMPYCYQHSLFVINEEPMNIFLKKVTPKFFNTKLNTYFFEGAMPLLVSKTGHYMYVNNILVDGIDITNSTSKWIEKNNLQHLHKYIINLKTHKYKYHQLFPPFDTQNYNTTNNTNI